MDIFLTNTLKNLLFESPSKDVVFQRNVLKEYFQIMALDFIYAHPAYSQLFFYGGSCLSHCYGLPRLSEDLDFVDVEGTIHLNVLANDLNIFIKKETNIALRATVQKFRVYLKFPILHDLGLAAKDESDMLFLKVEVFKDPRFCTASKTEHIPLFKYNRSLIVKTFDLPTLMSTKIRAVLLRKWEKTDKAGNILATVKGRDYFDLMWYFGKGIRPNLECIPEANSLEDLKSQLLAVIARVDIKSIRYDLEALLDNKQFLETVSNNMRTMLESQITKL